MRHAFALLAKMKRLRGTALDPFARTEERRWERALIAEFEGDVDRVLRELTAERLALATELLALPQRIRGFGHVKKAQGEEAARRRAMLWSRWQETGKAGATKSSAAGHPMPA
jgi:indolepyruvate ferredoxin oxidoreductase